MVKKVTFVHYCTLFLLKKAWYLSNAILHIFVSGGKKMCPQKISGSCINYKYKYIVCCHTAFGLFLLNVFILAWMSLQCTHGGCLMELCIQLSITMLGKQLIQNNLFEIGIP